MKKSFTQNKSFLIPLSLSIILTLLFFRPINLYINNRTELWFNIFNLLIPCLIVSLILSAILFFILLIASKLNFNIYKIIIGIVLSINVGFIVQSNFLNISLGSGVVNGSEINWSNYLQYGVIDTAVWLIIFIVIISIMLLVNKNFKTVISITSICLILIQIISTSVVIITNNDNLTNRGYNVTKEGIYELSSNNNTLVFMLDSLDHQIYKGYIDKHPETKKKLTGFIEYDNALTSAAYTSLALPTIISGKPYDEIKNEKYSEYINNIWKNDNIYKEMKKSNIDNRLFIENLFVGNNSNGIDSQINNIVSLDYNFEYIPAMLKQMYKLSLYDCMPFFLKKPFVLNLNESSPKASENSFSLNDANLYSEYQKNKGFRYTDKYQGAFRFYEMLGAHIPYTLTKDCKVTSIASMTSLEEQVEGCFKCLTTMFDDLKRNKIYDKTAIIILADHGDYQASQHISLLYKPKNSKGEYKTSHSPISTIDIVPTILSSFGIQPDKYGSGTPLTKVNESNTRPRKFIQGDLKLSYNTIISFSSNSKADDLYNLQFTNYSFDEGLSPKKLKLNQSYSWKKSTKLNNNICSGYSEYTDSGIQLKSPIANVILPLDQYNHQNLQLNLKLSKVDTKSNCHVYVNSKEIYNGSLNTNQEIITNIDKSLINEDNTLYVRFYFDDIQENNINFASSSTKTIMLKSVKIQENPKK